MARELAGLNLIDGVEERAAEDEQSAPVHRVGTGAEHDQHACEADDDRRPAARPHPLAEKGDR